MSLKSILAKIKLVNSYPYKIPNTNLSVISDNTIEIDRIDSATVKVTKDIITYENCFNSRNISITDTNSVFKLSTNNYVTIDYNNRFVMLRILGGAYCFITGDFIHILFSLYGNIYFDMVVLSLDTLDIVKRVNSITCSRIPEFVWGSYSNIECMDYIEISRR